jgi:hypothetical protein
MEKYSFNVKTAYDAPCFRVEFEYEFIEAEAMDASLCYLRDDSKFRFKNIKITNQNPHLEYRVCDWWPTTNVLKISAYKKGTDIYVPQSSNYNDTYWYEGDEYFSTISVYMHEKNKIKCEQWFGSFGNTKTIENGGTFVTVKKKDMMGLSQESIRQLTYNTIYPNGKPLLADNKY